MKSYREIADNVFARREQYVIAQRKKKQRITRITASVSSVALVSLASFALFRNDAFHETPPISDGKPTATTNTPTEIGDTTTANNATATTVAPTTPTTSVPVPSQTTTPSKTQSPTVTTVTQTHATQTKLTSPTILDKPLITADELDNGSFDESALRKTGKYITPYLRQMMKLYEGADVIYAVIVEIPIMEEDTRDDFWNSTEGLAQFRKEYYDVYHAYYEEAKRLNPSWDGKSTTIKVWTDTLRMNHERWLELLDEELDIIERYMGPYVESVLNQRFEALNALCKKEPVDIYCAVNGILNVGFHAYYVELTADAINTLTERGGYVFRLALFNQTDYGYWDIDE